MNKVILIGRLTKDPEVKSTSNQTALCNFTIAVDRRFKDANGNRQADFINCVAWRQQASLIGSYFHKGSRIAIVGNLQSRSYEDNQGQKRYVTEVVVDEVEFVDSANNNNSGNGYQNTQAAPVQAPVAPVAPSAPVAPAMSIAPSMDSSSFEPTDDSVELPFEV